MPSDYYTLITATGAAKIAAAIDAGTHVPLTHLAVGSGENDAPYEPVSTQTALKNETYRVGLQDVSVHPENANWVVANAVIPPEEGGWHIREVGIFDQAGDLFAIAKVPEIYKPVLAEGSGSDIDLKIILEIGNADTVQLEVDPSTVYAPKSWVLQQLVLHAESRSHPGGTEELKGFMQFASVLETIAGVINNKAVHPEGAAALIADLIIAHEQTSDHPNASTTVRGFVELATLTEAKAGADTVRAVTPAGLAAAISEALGSVGQRGVFSWQHDITVAVPAVANAFNRLPLDTEVHALANVSLNTSTGVLTLPEGTWQLGINIHALNIYNYVVAVRKTSDSSELWRGPASIMHEQNAQDLPASITAVITLADAADIELGVYSGSYTTELFNAVWNGPLTGLSSNLVHLTSLTVEKL